jgi:IS5 family transposase
MKKKPHDGRYIRFARLAYALTNKLLPRYRHRNSPKTYTQPQLVACVLLGCYLDTGWRELEDWLLSSDKVCALLELSAVPDHTTLFRAFQRLSMRQLEQLHQVLLRWLQVSETTMAIDATGFRPNRASQHYLSQTGRLMRDYVKGVYIVGLERRFILAWRYGRGPGGSEAQYLDGLRRRAHPYGLKVGRRREWILLGDKGFDGIQARPTDLIPPRQGQHPVVRPDRRLRLELVGQARLDGLYGRRVLIETVFSVMKRVSGDVIRARLLRHQRREVALKALVYNIHIHHEPFLLSSRTLQHSRFKRVWRPARADTSNSAGVT